MHEIVLRHAEAIVDLAEKDESLFFAAAACARSAKEAAVTQAWILDPKTRIEKEGRWLGYFETINKFHRNLNDELSDVDPNIDEELKDFSSYMDELKSRLIDGRPIDVVKKPRVMDMLDAIGYKSLYSSYRELCEIVHIGPEMVMRFKKGKRNSNGSLSVNITNCYLGNEWHIPFLAIGWATSLASMSLLHEFKRPIDKLKKLHSFHVKLNESLDDS